jgi:hypothetical protein
MCAGLVLASSVCRMMSLREAWMTASCSRVMAPNRGSPSMAAQRSSRLQSPRVAAWAWSAWVVGSVTAPGLKNRRSRRMRRTACRSCALDPRPMVIR